MVALSHQRKVCTSCWKDNVLSDTLSSVWNYWCQWRASVTRIVSVSLCFYNGGSIVRLWHTHIRGSNFRGVESTSIPRAQVGCACFSHSGWHFQAGRSQVISAYLEFMLWPYLYFSLLFYGIFSFFFLNIYFLLTWTAYMHNTCTHTHIHPHNTHIKDATSFACHVCCKYFFLISNCFLIWWSAMSSKSFKLYTFLKLQDI